MAALAFFVRLVLRNGLSLHNRGIGETVGIVAAGSFFYAAAVGLLALVWSGLAGRGVKDKAKRRLLATSYLKSQFAKYLPGNIFQFAARHALGRQLGIAHASLASAAIIEAILLITAASLIVGMFGGSLVKALFSHAPLVSPLFVILLVVLVVLLIAYLPRIAQWQWLPSHGLALISASLAGYLLFFVIFGSLFLVILNWSTDATHPTSLVLSSASLAWLVGFLVPGAPAGAGLREAALALAAGTNEENAQVLSAIVIFRLVTLIGDLIAFLAGWWIARGGGVHTAQK